MPPPPTPSPGRLPRRGLLPQPRGFLVSLWSEPVWGAEAAGGVSPARGSLRGRVSASAPSPYSRAAPGLRSQRHRRPRRPRRGAREPQQSKCSGLSVPPFPAGPLPLLPPASLRAGLASARALLCAWGRARAKRKVLKGGFLDEVTGFGPAS